MGSERDATDIQIAVIGLGYVGLPLAVAFAKHVEVIGYDINADIELIDKTIEVCTPDWLQAGAIAPESSLTSRIPIFIVGLPRTGTPPSNLPMMATAAMLRENIQMKLEPQSTADRSSDRPTVTKKMGVNRWIMGFICS